jgi:hypothetical protein
MYQLISKISWRMATASKRSISNEIEAKWRISGNVRKAWQQRGIEESIMAASARSGVAKIIKWRIGRK